MDDAAAVRNRLESLLTTQRLGVLSTHDRGQPYASLVAYAVTEDLGGIVFTTTRATRKFAYLTADPRVAMLINDSVNAVSDFHRAAAVTALGRAAALDGQAAARYLPGYIEKHPYLESFAAAPTTAMVRIEVDRYILVKQFQKVIEIDLPFTVDAAP